MEQYINELESHIDELVRRISQLEKLDDLPEKFKSLDRRLVSEIQTLREYYNACKTIEELQKDSQELDDSIDTLLLKLAYSRRELMNLPSVEVIENKKVDSEDVLDYAARIARFTRQTPGPAGSAVLPWPGEDQLRKGMLATLAVQMGTEGAEPVDETTEIKSPEVEPISEPTGAPERRQRRPQPAKVKINLDFDSDNDD